MQTTDYRGISRDYTYDTLDDLRNAVDRAVDDPDIASFVVTKPLTTVSRAQRKQNKQRRKQSAKARNKS